MTGLVMEEEFFAPAATDLVDNLCGNYLDKKNRIEALAASINSPEAAPYVSYFLNGNLKDRERLSRPVDYIFKVDGALASLNSEFWSRLLSLTDVYEYMPQARRSEWNEQISEMKAPAFEEETVRPTIAGLLNSRQQFFSERVDGIFRALSGEHVTNRPEGFSKRMIMFISSSSGLTTDNVGVINDLRTVIAKFMGRDAPSYNSTAPVIKAAYRKSGEWVTLDGGALRLCCYMKGTAHLEVHPEMAWRLNGILAHMYPTAIPAEFRQKPKKKLKDFVLMERPLPFAVVDLLATVRLERSEWWTGRYNDKREGVTKNPNARGFDGHTSDKYVQAEAEKVMQFLGGTRMNKNAYVWFEFDYNPDDVIAEVVASGCIPESKSHQFYPTPAGVAERCIGLADIGLNHTCLEPSAGQGGLADYMPADRTQCIEISALQCVVLESKGFKTICADFIKWAGGLTPTFDRIVMNPPFSEGRALAHLQAAAGCLKPSGRLVAVLPESFRNKDVLPGFSLDWSETILNEFAGTSVSVVILKADKE